MGRRGTEQRRLTAQLNVRLPKALLEAVRRRAADVDVTDAAWVRELVTRTLAADPGHRQSVEKRIRSRPAPTVDVVAVARLREAVGEAVGTLRQAAGLERNRSGARLAEIDAALDQLLGVAAALDAAKAEMIRAQVAS